MITLKPLRVGLVALAFSLTSVTAQANVWVFEPSAAIDQRVDDNFTIDTTEADPVSVTRVVGTLGLSRESQRARFKGLVRIDGLLTNSRDFDSDLSSNQLFFLDSRLVNARTSYGLGINIRRDTPIRDIAADLTDIASVASDTGASVTQDSDLRRLRFIVEPTWKHELSRRSSVEATFSYTQTEHELQSAQQALEQRFELVRPGDDIPDDLSIDTEGIGVFTILDELDDFKEAEVQLGYRYKLSRISTFSVFAGYSQFESEVEPDPAVSIPFEELIPDEEIRQILRAPKRTSRSTTSTFRLGYDRGLTPTLSVESQIGIYINTLDNTDVLRDNDIVFLDPATLAATLAARTASSQGFLGNVTFRKDAGITQYTARFAVDVLPSDIGSQVESLEATGDMFRKIGPLLDFSFQVRAFEPDALNANTPSEFQRRFLSLEPKLIWRFSRAWTFAGSYRYRRQKSQIDTSSGESNALLFSLKYTPPSAIRDAEAGRVR